jgi:hypothetical protein
MTQEFDTPVCVIRGEFVGSSTNAQGEKKISFMVDRGNRMEAEEVADLAGLMLEFRIYRMEPAEWETDPAFNVINLPTPQVPT